MSYVFSEAVRKHGEAVHLYSICVWGAEEVIAFSGQDSIVHYFGEESFYSASSTRTEKDFYFGEYGTIVYNYGRDEYDICLDCRDYEKSCEWIKLRNGESFSIWLDGEWESTAILYNYFKNDWYLDGFDDMPLEGLRVRYYSKRSRLKHRRFKNAKFLYNKHR
jgi:hypothetical protein